MAGLRLAFVAIASEVISLFISLLGQIAARLGVVEEVEIRTLTVRR